MTSINLIQTTNTEHCKHPNEHADDSQKEVEKDNKENSFSSIHVISRSINAVNSNIQILSFAANT